MSLSEIIEDIHATKLIQFLPPKKRKFPLADKSKYCKFHKDYGHDSNDYVTLKDEIKSLIRRGRFSRYRQYENERNNKSRTKEHNHDFPDKEITTTQP